MMSANQVDAYSTWNRKGMVSSHMLQTQPQAAGNPHLMQPVTSHRPVLASDARDNCIQTDFAQHIEHLRAAFSSQRFRFERDRAAFAEERKLWEKERAILKRRIADLEQDL